MVGAALLMAAPGAYADERVDAGALAARVAPDPWGLTFADARGDLLAEHPELTLGFKVGDVRYRAVRQLAGRREGGAYVATLATDDPAGRTIDVRVSRDGEGIVAVAATVNGGPVETTGIGFRAVDGERYLGFGERSNAVDQRGNVVENFVADGPYLPEERPVIALFVPPQGFGSRDDSTYYPVPWVVSTRGYGVLLDNDENSHFHMAADRSDAWSMDANAGSLSFRVFAGPRPRDVVARMTGRLGRQPAAAAPFYFGPWWQPKDDDANVAALRDADAPASVVQTYTHYLPCGDQVGKTDAERARVQKFHDAGMAITTYFNPMICQGRHPAFDEAAGRGLLTRNASGQPYLYRYTGTSQFLVGQFDFGNPEATDFFGRLLAEAVADGHDGWMEDFGEYTPADAQHANGKTGEAGHNSYVVDYHRAAYEYARRAGKPVARFNRSGWTGAARWSQIVWGGDPTTDWGFDGLQSSIRQGLTMGLSGVSLWGSDIGGFFALAKDQTTPELLSRWIEFGAVSGVMRTQANGFAVGEKSRRAQIFDADVMPVWRRYAKLRTQLYPYLASADRDYQLTGLPIMRHLALAYPGDAKATGRDDEFLFGPDLLAAPVVTPGATRRSVYLPAGRWVDLWRSVDYVGRDGSLRAHGARVLSGARTVTVPAPLDELPLFARAGTILPLLPADVDTLAEYGGRGVVKLSERARRLRLIVFPRGRTSKAIPGASISSRERSGGWSLSVRVPGGSRQIDFEAALGTLRRKAHVCAVTVDGKPLSARRWSYDRRRRLLTGRFTARRSATLVAVTDPGRSGSSAARCRP